MRWKWVGIGVLVVVLLVVVAGVIWAVTRPAEAKVPRSLKPSEVGKYSDHTDLFRKEGITRYEGSKSCIECHEREVQEVFHSIHYQMKSPVPDIEGREPVVHGGRLAYNDFCGAIFWQGEVPINFIGKAVLKVAPEGQEEKVGTFIASGCSMCHGTSMGLVPKDEPTPEQLGNIDCLACHSDIYLSGPIVEVPTKDACLGCHAYSGGGPGFKRPNLTPALMGDQVPEDIDVHIARGMHCVDCHIEEEHKFPTIAVDTWSREAENPPTCTSCHKEDQVHQRALLGWVINTFHLEKVACQTCHIPRFAKQFPTDMKRDWSHAEFVPKGARWEPLIQFEKDVEPVYRWWNEKTRIAYLYPEPATVSDGKITYLAPVGGPARRVGLIGWESDGKLYPFKYHETVVPFDPEKQVPIPIKVGIVFATGNTEKAIQAGAKASGLTFTGEFVTLVRYMAVNHGVEPAENALGCLDCHGLREKRMPWQELGYGHYPEIAFGAALLVVGLVVAGGAWLGVRAWRR